MTEPEEDFAAMFEASLKAKRFERGETIEGTIVAIGPDVAFVNVGGKGEAVIELDELKNDDGVLEVAVGDRIQAMVVSTEGGLTLSRRARARRGERAAARRRVSRRPPGRRQGRTGGEGRLRGAHRPPARLLPGVPDRHRRGTRHRRTTKGTSTRSASSSTRKAAGTSSCRGGRCRRRSSRRGPPRSASRSCPARSSPGASPRCVDFGAFVDLGAGIQGLLHVSEMGWSRVSHASEVVTPGQEITVKVLRVDEQRSGSRSG